MTTRLGVCTNAGRCPLGVAATLQEVGEDEAFECRECGSPLRAPPRGAADAGPTAHRGTGPAGRPSPRPATSPGQPRAAGPETRPADRMASSPGARIPSYARPAGAGIPPGRFALGASMGAAAFGLMAVFAFWVTHGWVAPPAARPKIAAAARPAEAPAPPPAGKGQLLLRLAGSGTIGAQLGPALAEAFLASLGDAEIQTSPRAPEVVEVRGTRAGAPQSITVAAHGSAEAFEALQAGTADVGMSSRRVRPEEAHKLAALGVMTSAANEHVLALDGIAVIVSKANPVSQLRREQLAAIFAGTTADWSAVGGTPGPVHLYAAGERSGTVDAFQAMVLRGGTLSPGLKRLESNQAVLEAVVGDVSGVGLVGLPWTRGVKSLAVNEAPGTTPMIPNAFTLAGEDYFLARRLYLYTAAAPANPYVSRFVEFALGPQGQEVVRKAGFVELTIRAEPRPAPEGAPRDYLRLTDSARRLTTAFRFVVGSSELDNRALNDLDRVVDFLREHDLNGASVRLLGFADSQGGASTNRALSRGRALRVAQALAQRGISGATLDGFGAALPVADNSSEAGRERNRRVEIWITR